MEILTHTVCARITATDKAEPFRVEFQPRNDQPGEWPVASPVELAAVQATAHRIADTFYDRLGSYFLEEFISRLCHRLMDTRRLSDEKRAQVIKALQALF